MTKTEDQPIHRETSRRQINPLMRQNPQKVHPSMVWNITKSTYLNVLYYRLLASVLKMH